MITTFYFWVIRDSSGREAFATARLSDAARAAYELTGHTVHGPVSVLLPAPKPVQQVDLSEGEQ